MKDSEKIAHGVFALETPGHTRDHVSVVVDTDAFRVAERFSHGDMMRKPRPRKIVIAGEAAVT